MVRLSVLFLLTICVIFTQSTFASSLPGIVDYDAQQDLLRINAPQNSLTELCQRISEVTQVSFDIAPEAEQTVTFISPPKKLKETLQDLVTSAHLSHMFIYATKDGITRLYQVKILPNRPVSEKTHDKQNTAMTTEQRRKFLAEIREKRQKELDQAMPKLSKPTQLKNTVPIEPALPQPPSAPSDHQGFTLPGWNSQTQPIGFNMQPTLEQGDNK